MKKISLLVFFSITIKADYCYQIKPAKLNSEGYCKLFHPLNPSYKNDNRIQNWPCEQEIYTDINRETCMYANNITGSWSPEMNPKDMVYLGQYYQGQDPLMACYRFPNIGSHTFYCKLPDNGENTITNPKGYVGYNQGQNSCRSTRNYTCQGFKYDNPNLSYGPPEAFEDF